MFYAAIPFCTTTHPPTICNENEGTKDVTSPMVTKKKLQIRKQWKIITNKRCSVLYCIFVKYLLTMWQTDLVTLSMNITCTRTCTRQTPFSTALKYTCTYHLRIFILIFITFFFNFVHLCKFTSLSDRKASLPTKYTRKSLKTTDCIERSQTVIFT